MTKVLDMYLGSRWAKIVQPEFRAWNPHTMNRHLAFISIIPCSIPVLNRLKENKRDLDDCLIASTSYQGVFILKSLFSITFRRPMYKGYQHGVSRLSSKIWSAIWWEIGFNFCDVSGVSDKRATSLIWKVPFSASPTLSGIFVWIIPQVCQILKWCLFVLRKTLKTQKPTDCIALLLL